MRECVSGPSVVRTYLLCHFRQRRASDLTAQLGETITLTLAVSDGPPLLIDEIRLGSSVKGGYLIHLPLVYRQW